MQILRMVRFQNWYYFLALVGIAALDSRPHFDLTSLAIAVVFNLTYLSWLYLTNNHFDLAEDEVEKNAFKELGVSANSQRLAALGLTVAFLGISFALDLLVPSLTILLLNFLYLTPPLRLKRNYFFAALANGAFFSFVYFSSFQILDGQLTPEAREFCIFVSLIMIFIQHLHHLENRLDAKSAIPTTAFREQLALAILVLLYLSTLAPLLTVLLKGATFLFLSTCLLLLKRQSTIADARRGFRNAGFGLGLIILLERLWI